MKHLWLRAVPVLFLLGAGYAQDQPAPPDKPLLKKGVLPAGVAPLAPATQAKMQRLVREAERWRGLALNEPVPMGQLDEPGLKRQLLVLFNEELPPAVLGNVERVLKCFGLLPPALDLADYYPKLLTSQVGGYYDPKRKYLVLVQREGGILGPELSKKMGALGERMEETVLVHEVNHAIQDQHFDLERLDLEKPLRDDVAARTALVEGDATLVMQDYHTGLAMEGVPGLDQQLALLAQQPEALAEMMPEMPGAKEMREAPAFLRQNLVFPYIYGMVFCIKLRQRGGQKLLDYAFAKDPPRSTEQILHPEKWLDQRDDPIVVQLPDLSQVLPGYRKAIEGVWGEFNIGVLLNERLKKTGTGPGAAAALGWGGDAFSLYVNAPSELVSWVTEWDTEQDAQKFLATALKAFPEAGEWAVSRPVKQLRRVIVCRFPPEMIAADRARVVQALEGAKALLPDNRRVDLAALGITAQDKPKPVNPGDILKMFQEPAAQDLLKGGSVTPGSKPGDTPADPSKDLAKLLDDPAFKDAAAKMLGGDAGGVGGGDLAKLLSDPALQEMAMKMLQSQKELPKGRIEGDTYTNAALQFSFKAPAAAGWKLNDQPKKVGPVAPLVEVLDPHGQSRVQVVAQELPIPIEIQIEALAPLLEMGFQAQFKDFRKVQSRAVEAGTRKGYEWEFTAEGQHVLQRVFMAGGKLLVVVGSVPNEDWERQQGPVREAVGNLIFTKP